MPPGWITQWDQNSQRWYYIEQATGRTQWDPPVQSPAPQGPYAPPPPPGVYGAPPYGQQHGAPDERGLFGNTHAPGAPGYAGGAYDHNSQSYGHGDSQGYGHSDKDQKNKDKKDKDKGHSTAMLAAAGVGGVAAGAWIGHEMSARYSSFLFL